jgi:hypothetical protein
VSALVVRFLTELAAGETDAEGLKREERALRERIGSFRAADRLAREAVHRRDLRMGRALPTPTSSSTPLAPATDIKWIATEHAMTISVGAKMTCRTPPGVGTATIQRIEKSDGPIAGYVSTVMRIEAAFEKAGILFIAGDEIAGTGIRLAKNRLAKKKTMSSAL